MFYMECESSAYQLVLKNIYAEISGCRAGSSSCKDDMDDIWNYYSYSEKHASILIFAQAFFDFSLFIIYRDIISF